jgi:hypothetical protein
VEIKDVVIILIASLFVGRFLEFPWSYGFIVRASKCAPWTAPKFLQRSQWEITWEVDSSSFPSRNASVMQHHVFLNLVAGEWNSQPLNGQMKTYRLVGRRSATNKLTGLWYDKNLPDLGYAGALQMVYSPLGSSASGKWIGFSADHSVKAGGISIRCPEPL